MKTISIILFAIIAFFVPINAQWISFELDNIDSEKFQKQVEPLLETISLSTNRHFFSPINIDKRASLGVSYSQGFNISGEEYSTNLIGGYPSFAGSLVVTNNLLLKGNISIFKSGNDIVQSFAYGFGLNLTNEETNNW